LPTTAADMFERHHLAIYRYLLRMLGSRESAEELTQDVFVRAIKSAGLPDEPAGERAWLFRIARNLRIDHARRQRRAPVMASVDDEHVAAPASQALRASLLQGLAMLPDEEREAFVLAEVAGLSYQEIAVACAATQASIRSRIYRARMQLRATLDVPTAGKPLA
jgi:RNA polymerase sigma-70 factor, ECF subfamily